MQWSRSESSTGRNEDSSPHIYPKAPGPCMASTANRRPLSSGRTSVAVNVTYVTLTQKSNSATPPRNCALPSTIIIHCEANITDCCLGSDRRAGTLMSSQSRFARSRHPAIREFKAFEHSRLDSSGSRRSETIVHRRASVVRR